MLNELKYSIIIIVIFFAIIIINCIRKNKLDLKYALVWLGTLFAMLITILIPNFLEEISKFLGFEVLSNMIFLVAIIVLMLISFSLTIIVSKQKKMIQLLIQEVSIIKSDRNGDNKND